MPDIESLLTRWQSAGVIDAEAAARIRSFEGEHKKPAGLRWQGVVAWILGAILLAAGVILFVSAHWDQIGPAERLTLVLAMVSVFHIGGALSRESSRGLSTALHAVENNKLVAYLSDSYENSTGMQFVSLRPGAPCDQLTLQQAVNFYIAEHAQSPLPVKPGDELWIEVTVPPQGPPRPLQLALKHQDGAWQPLTYR